MKYTNFILTVIAFLLFANFLSMNNIHIISTANAQTPVSSIDAKPLKVVIVGVGQEGNLEDTNRGLKSALPVHQLNGSR
jgi:hypothetical protein